MENQTKYVIAIETDEGTKLWQKGSKFVPEYPDAREFDDYTSAARAVAGIIPPGGAKMVIIENFGYEDEQRWSAS